MATQTKLTYAAAVLALLTSIIHLIGTLMPIPAEQTDVIATVATMEATLVPMPIGSAKSYMQILNGNNYGTALLLFVCSLLLFSSAGSQEHAAANRTIAIAGVGLVGFAIISLTHFFPIPAFLTGSAALLCLIAFFGKAADGRGTQ